MLLYQYSWVTYVNLEEVSFQNTEEQPETPEREGKKTSRGVKMSRRHSTLEKVFLISILWLFFTMSALMYYGEFSKISAINKFLQDYEKEHHPKHVKREDIENANPNVFDFESVDKKSVRDIQENPDYIDKLANENSNVQIAYHEQTDVKVDTNFRFKPNKVSNDWDPDLIRKQNKDRVVHKFDPPKAEQMVNKDNKILGNIRNVPDSFAQGVLVENSPDGNNIQVQQDNFPSLNVNNNKQIEYNNKDVTKEGWVYLQGSEKDQVLNENIQNDIHKGVEENEEDMVVDLDSILPLARPDAPGEYGEPVIVDLDALSPEERTKHDNMYETHQFDEYVSEMISLRRRLPDYRDNNCKMKQYDTTYLPHTSVIICFHNEAWSTLLRTVFSVLDRSPPHLIKEIILVDDASTFDYLKKPLEDYMNKLKKVKIIRSEERQGLVRARLMGIAAAKGQVLTFLDSHCECHPGWLEPLLTRLVENPKVVIAPVINVIFMDTLKTDFAPLLDIGTFDLQSMSFRWRPIQPHDEKHRKDATDPYKSPTMAGGLFCMYKDYFEELGSYDPGMDIWGGENLEMSFRVWMCGGEVEIHPCSHVGHIFRTKSPYSWGKPVNLIVKKNAVRVAEVWMDEYRKVYYENFADDLGDYGDVSERKQLRDGLKCKSFRWYLENIATDVSAPEDRIFRGTIVHDETGLCIETQGYEKYMPCQPHSTSQFLVMTASGLIKRGDLCAHASKSLDSVHLAQCTGTPYENWQYNTDKTIQLKGTDRCFNTKDRTAVSLDTCIPSSQTQFSWSKIS